MTQLIITIFAFMSMEAIAWLTHKYIMHGFLWRLHKDHHKKETSGFLEQNDFFFLIFALPGILGLILGIQNNFNFLFWIGLGITFYGMTYFFVHDIFIHQRFKLFRNIDNNYFKSIRRAHKMHHKFLNKTGGVCFGMLWVPLHYFRDKKIND